MHLSPGARRTVVATTLSALSLGIAGQAFAESVVLPDPADATASLSDIRKVKADHGEAQLFVKVSFTELEPESDGGPSQLSVFVDTTASKPGPEFRLGTGLQSGTDYQLVRMKDWKVVSGPLSCQHSLGLDFGANTAKANFGRACLGSPEEVRVGVKMMDLFDGSHPITDWLKKPRGWTGWLAAG